jgi:hypothetical protein
LGLVSRLPDPEDRRGVIIALTPEGRRVVDRVIEVRLADAKRNVSVFATDEKKQLAGLLRDLLIAVSTQHSLPADWEALSAPPRSDAPPRRRRSRARKPSEVQ